MTARSRSSTSSSYKTLDETDSADAPSGNISHQRLHPSQARNYFSPARVDAQDVDFSDRISSKRRSYKTSSRRRRRRRPDGSGEGEEEELGDFSDEDDDDGEAEEGLKRKIARLRREVEEVKAEVGRRRAERIERGGEGEDEDEEGSGVAGLVDVIDALQLSQDEAGVSAGARLVKQLGKPPPAPLPKTQAPQLELASIHQVSPFPVPYPIRRTTPLTNLSSPTNNPPSPHPLSAKPHPSTHASRSSSVSSASRPAPV